MWYTLSTKEVEKQMQTNIEFGLNEKQVEALKAFMEACGEEPDNVEIPHKKGFKNIFKK